MTEKNRFPHAVAFRLDTPTFEALGVAAEAAGVSPGVWVRTLALKALGSAMKAPAVRRAAVNAELLNEVLGELRKHGGNLNQLTRLANGSGSLVAAEADIAAMRTATEALMVRVLDLLRIKEDA